MKRTALLSSLCAALCLAGLYAYSKIGSSRNPLGLAGNQRPNIVFILVDTLRADHMPFHGYREDTAPFISSLADKAVVFDRAVSPSSWTPPALASIFTSTLPSRHGVFSPFGAFKRVQDYPREDWPSLERVTPNVIPKGIATMGEIMKEAGYNTFWIGDNPFIGPEFGFTRGFDKFKRTLNEGAEILNATVKEWKKDIETSQPYFLYLHYMDPHGPYERREPWYEEGRTPKIDHHGEQIDIDAYDSEIRHVDEHINELFRLFGWGDDTVVIFLSDHGEEFREHGKIGHGNQLYIESIHVPFFVKFPGVAPRRIERETSTIDVLPTLCAALGIRSDPGWQGRSLLPVIRGGDEEARPIVSELLRLPVKRREPAWRSVIAEKRHLLEREWERRGSRSELYDLETDFAERNNLLPGAEAHRAKLRELLDSAQLEAEAADEEPKEIEIDHSIIDSLRSLGYLR